MANASYRQRYVSILPETAITSGCGGHVEIPDTAYGDTGLYHANETRSKITIVVDTISTVGRPDDSPQHVGIFYPISGAGLFFPIKSGRNDRQAWQAIDCVVFRPKIVRFSRIIRVKSLISL